MTQADILIAEYVSRIADKSISKPKSCNSMTYRVLVSTDLGGDPDDIQSLYRLIHYSDVLKVEGITSCTGPGSTPSADLIRHWIQRVDVEHLRAKSHPKLMTEETLLGSVVQGTPTPGRPGSASRDGRIQEDHRAGLRGV